MFSKDFSVVVLLASTLVLNGLLWASQNGTDAEFVPNSYLTDGVKLASKGDFGKAQEKLEAGLAYWQVHANALLYLRVISDIDDKKLKKKEARNIFKALHNDFNLKHKKAEKSFRKIAKKKSGYFPVLAFQAEALSNMEKPEEAENLFETALNEVENDPLAFVIRGRFYSKIDDSEKAVADFSKAISLDNKMAIAFFERGFTHGSERDYDAAIKNFEVAAKQHPKWLESSVVVESYHNRGVENMNKKRFRKALADFNKAIELEPEHSAFYLNRGLAYRGLKKYSQAIAEMTISIEKKPDYADGYYQRAATHYKRKHYKKAIGDFKKCLELRPGDTNFKFKLAEAYYKDGQYKKAISLFDALIAQNNTLFWAHYWKAYSHKYLGQRRSALSSFQKFLAIAPQQYRGQRAYAEAEIRNLKK